MAVMLLYTIFSIYGAELAVDTFLDSIGFLLAGGSMILLHPKLIPLPEKYRVQ